MKANIAGVTVLLIVAGISGLIYYSVRHVQIFVVPIGTVGQPASSTITYKVIEVVDGDTIDVLIDGKKERIRYIGIDTPETVGSDKPADCFGKESSKRNSELVFGKQVRLVKDVSDRDTYGRLLRYVYREDMFVNQVLISEGYATALTIPPDVSNAILFKNAERNARNKSSGLWAACKF